jgi:hypothetical protein
MPRLQDAPGTTLRLLVVSTGTRHCAGIDLESGALVRAWSPTAVDPRLRPYDLVSVMLDADVDLVPDPAEPEAVPLAGPPRLTGRLTGRAAHRLVRPLLHPAQAPLLGFHGATVPFWERTPDRPSVALAQPTGGLVVTAEGDGTWCHFPWARRPMVLACQDPRLQAALARRGRRLATMPPGTLLVVALSPPVDGHCYKVVEAVVPRR